MKLSREAALAVLLRSAADVLPAFSVFSVLPMCWQIAGVSSAPGCSVGLSQLLPAERTATASFMATRMLDAMVGGFSKITCTFEQFVTAMPASLRASLLPCHLMDFIQVQTGTCSAMIRQRAACLSGLHISVVKAFTAGQHDAVFMTIVLKSGQFADICSFSLIWAGMGSEPGMVVWNFDECEAPRPLPEGGTTYFQDGMASLIA